MTIKIRHSVVQLIKYSEHFIQDYYIIYKLNKNNNIVMTNILV